MAELRLQQCRLDGRYDILQCLGRGSYAEIYAARDNAAPVGAPETVVVKALNLLLREAPDMELERTLITNFQNEAVALDRVRHPHIISRLGHGTAVDLAGTTFHYLVIEYLPGGDMAALSRNRPLSLDRALFYLEQVCSGLAHAHNCSVIHRDIKPQNLLLTADREVVKIADFGVARLDATEGAITRVGTNIYSAPEHNPLVHTGQLLTASLASAPDHLTAAADIYSLAKTTFTLLAGEPPRRFAQHAIVDLPAVISGKPWSTPLLRVLERATQSRSEDRYQTVADFWDEIAAAAQQQSPLLATAAECTPTRRLSADLLIEPDEMTQAPPRPQFAAGEAADSSPVYLASARPRGPRIVVPVRQVLADGPAEAARPEARGRNVAAAPNLPQNGSSFRPRPKSEAPRRGRRFLVAGFLILSFSGMLLATHRYVTSRWNPLAEIPQLANTFIVGREGVTTTDVNLRPDPGMSSDPVGKAEQGSRVRVLSVNNNWYEVQVMQHSRQKDDPFSSDRGWVNKKYLKFD